MVETAKLNDAVYVTGQIGPEDVADIAARGFRAVINNRPDGEGGAAQPTSESVRAAAEAQGLTYHYLPMTVASLTPDTVSELHELLSRIEGPVLLHCRSGARSTVLWAIRELALGGREPADVLAEAAAAGHDLSGARPLIEAMTARLRAGGG